jgi:hypothetical protein
MNSRNEWDYSLRLGGVTLEGLGLARLAEYMTGFAELLGEDAHPVFAGVVKGSVVLRVKDRSEVPAVTRSRLRRAANDPGEPAHRPYAKLSKLLLVDGARGIVLDRCKVPVVEFPTKAEPHRAQPQEFVVSESAEIDGVIVAVEGIDDTAHLGVQDQATRQVVRIQCRDMRLARMAAANFRGEVLRIRVHGTWRRDSAGQWSPLSIYADAIEPLDQSDARAAFEGLAQVQGIAWTEMGAADADRLADELRNER